MSAIGLFTGACSSPATRACNRLAGICGVELSRDDLRDCAETIQAASQETHTDVGKKILGCTDGADSCAEVLGCAVGVGAGVLTSLVEQFERGFNRGAGGERSSGTQIERSRGNDPGPDSVRPPVNDRVFRHSTRTQIRVTEEHRTEYHEERHEEHHETWQESR